MAQINEDCVSFETAKLLNEKGFDWCESPFYSEQDRDEWRQNNSYTIPNMLYDPDLPFDSETLTMVAPHVSIQMAMKWLREVHNIIITIRLFNSAEYFYLGEPNQFTVDIATTTMSSQKGHIRTFYSTYEEAAEAAIKYCLENLI